MVLMIACMTGIAYASVLAALDVIVYRRARRSATPRHGVLRLCSAGLCAGIVLAALTFDTSCPKTIAMTGARWQRARATSVRFVVSDAGWGVFETLYRIDHGSWQVGTCARVTTQGDHAVLYRSVGRDGRSEVVHLTSVGIDQLPPTTTCDARSWMSGPVTVMLRAQDAGSGVASTDSRLDGGEWHAGNAVYVPDQGRHTIQYRSTDRVGNVESTQTKTFFVVDEPPVTRALDPVTVRSGGRAIIRFVVSDLTPRAAVTIRMKGPRGTTAYDIGLQPTNRVDAVELVCRMPCGAYSYEVLATDLASARSRINGSNTLRVPVRALALRAWADDLSGTANAQVVAFCNVTDQYGQPIRGARVSLLWRCGKAEVCETTLMTGPGGGTYSCHSLPRSSAGRPVTIRITASWHGQKKTVVVRLSE